MQQECGVEHHHCFIIKVKYQASAGESDVNEVGEKKTSHSPAATQHLNESSERERARTQEREKKPSSPFIPTRGEMHFPKTSFQPFRTKRKRSLVQLSEQFYSNKQDQVQARIHKALIVLVTTLLQFISSQEVKNFLFHILFVITPHFNVIHCDEF